MAKGYCFSDCVPERPFVADGGIEDLEKRCGEEEVAFEWLSACRPEFVDLNTEFEATGDRAGVFG
ncbi:DUF6104 family protein [Streptomyces mirabilis]